jgi:hypothetical protein
MQKFLLLTVIALILSGCPFHNPNPLGLPGKDGVDTGLIGAWKCKAADYAVQYFKVAKGKKKSLTGMLVEGTDELGGATSFVGYTTDIQGKSFVYFKETGGSDYHFVHYRLSGNNLFTRTVRAESLEGARLGTMGDLRYEFTSRIQNKATDFLDPEVIWEKQ